MGYQDVTVVITRETAAVTEDGFGLPLILAVSKVHPYTLYSDLQALAVDFAADTEEYKMAAAIFAQEPRPAQVAVYGMLYGGIDPAELAAALNALMLTNSDWYVLHCPEQGDEEITALSAWIDTQDKLYFATTTRKELFATLNSEKTILVYHDEPDSYPEAAWTGRCLTEVIGSVTWKFKTLNGIAPVPINATDYAQIHEDNGNTYVTKMGINQTSEGKTTAGEYIDVIMSQHWLKARMAESVQRLLSVSKKIPYDNTGIAMVVAEVQKVLRQAGRQGIVAQDGDGNYMWSVTAPNRADIPTNKIAQRILPDINWTVVIAGAVHSVEIHGVLSL